MQKLLVVNRVIEISLHSLSGLNSADLSFLLKLDLDFILHRDVP